MPVKWFCCWQRASEHPNYILTCTLSPPPPSLPTSPPSAPSLPPLPHLPSLPLPPSLRPSLRPPLPHPHPFSHLPVFLPASVMLPPKRLHKLLMQALQQQVDRCPFHYIEQSITQLSLLTDHICSRLPKHDLRSLLSRGGKGERHLHVGMQ